MSTLAQVRQGANEQLQPILVCGARCYGQPSLNNV